MIRVGLLLAVFCLSSCLTTMHVNVLYPAQIKVDPEVKKIVLGIRTHGAERRSPVFWPFSMDQAYYENDGIKQAMAGFAEQLQDNPRFTIANELAEFSGARRQTFGSLIPWKEVEAICLTRGAQGLVMLEIYDIDTREFDRRKDILSTDAAGKAVTIPEFEVEHTIRVTLGWRFYDISSHKVIDQHMLFEEDSFIGKGMSINEARNRLPYADQMVDQASRETGRIYAIRISPFWIRSKRSYYGSHDKNLKMSQATDLAKIEDWNGARQIWETLLRSEDKELLAKVTYNLALAHEVEGDLYGAIEWANRSYTEYFNKKARSYYLKLKERSIRLDRVEDQLNK